MKLQKKYLVSASVFCSALIIILFFIIWQKYEYKTLLKKYVVLSQKIWKLEDDIVDLKNFTIVDDLQNMKEGVTSKYWLKDEKDKKWIFKINPLRIHDYFEEKISHFIRLCGFNTPLLLTKSFLINKKKHFGSLQEFVDKEYDISHIELRTLNTSFLDEILAQEPITYLFDTEHEYVLSKKNELYTIDLNDIHFFDEETPFNFDGFLELIKIDKMVFGKTVPENFARAIYRYLTNHRYYNKIFTRWDSFYHNTNRGNRIDKSASLCAIIHERYIRNEIVPPLNKIAKSINFISDLDDDMFLKLVSVSKLKNNFFVDIYLKQVLERKHSLKTHFIKLYDSINQVSQKRFNVKFNAKYTKAEIKEKIELLQAQRKQLEKEKASLANKYSPQKELESRSSPDGHQIIYGFVHRLLSKRDTIAILSTLFRFSRTNSEKQAIRDYIEFVQNSPVMSALK